MKIDTSSVDLKINAFADELFAKDLSQKQKLSLLVGWTQSLIAREDYAHHASAPLKRQHSVKLDE